MGACAVTSAVSIASSVKSAWPGWTTWSCSTETGPEAAVERRPDHRALHGEPGLRDVGGLLGDLRLEHLALRAQELERVLQLLHAQALRERGPLLAVLVGLGQIRGRHEGPDALQLRLRELQRPALDLEAGVQRLPTCVQLLQLRAERLEAGLTHRDLELVVRLVDAQQDLVRGTKFPSFSRGSISVMRPPTCGTACQTRPGRTTP